MGQDILVPISDEQSKALQEGARLGVKALETAEKAGSYASDIVGNIPRDLVGLAFGDWLTHARLRRLDALQRETTSILKERDVQDRVEPSPSVAMPLLRAAVDEDREGLRSMWAKLLASAMDPKRTHLVRNSFMEILKQLDPLDAAVLHCLAQHQGAEMLPSRTEFVRVMLKRGADEIEVAYENLTRLGLFSAHHANRLTATGRAFLTAVG